MTFNTYCNGACNEYKECQYKDICCADLIEVTTFEDLENMRFITGMEFDKKDCVRDCGGTSHMSDLSEQIKDKAETIAKALEKGSRVELLQNKDGLKVLEIKREVVK